MKLHYLFGTRYAVSDKNNTQDLRHRNAIFGVHAAMRDLNYDIQYHYHNDDMLHSFSIGRNDIAINLHPQKKESLDLMQEAKAEHALCGVFIDNSDIPGLANPDNILTKAINSAHFVLVPDAVSAQLARRHNNRVWVTPPVIENKSGLPLSDLQDVQKRKRPLRIMSIIEEDQQDNFVYLLSSLIQTGKRQYPVDLTVFIRKTTGIGLYPPSDLFKDTIAGMVQLTKNQRIQMKTLPLHHKDIDKALHDHDILLVPPHHDPVSGNIQIPLMGLFAGLFVMVPTKSKIYAPIYEYGTIPYNPDQVRTVIAGLIMDPTLHMNGKIIKGQNLVKQYHTPEKVSAHLDRVFQTEMKYHNLKKHMESQKTETRPFWQKLGYIEPSLVSNEAAKISSQQTTTASPKSEKDELRVRRIEAVS